jgi:hypothetical protein
MPPSGSNVAQFGSLPAFPESIKRSLFAEDVGTQLQNGLGSFLGPEFLGPFDALIDLFHERLHVAAGDRQSLSPVFIVTHLVLVVLQVGPGFGYQTPRTRLAIGGFGRTELGLTLGQFGNDLGHLTLS